MLKRLAPLAVVLSILPLLGSPARAGENTEWLRDFFAKHYGPSIPGQPSMATVEEVEGRDVLTFDLNKLLRPFVAFGYVTTSDRSKFSLERMPDGTVRLTSTNGPPWTGGFGNRKTNIIFEGYRFEGLFEPHSGLPASSSTSSDEMKIIRNTNNGDYVDVKIGYIDRFKSSYDDHNLYYLEQETWIESLSMTIPLIASAGNLNYSAGSVLRSQLDTTRSHVEIDGVPAKSLKSALLDATYRAGETWTEADSEAFRQRLGELAPIFTFLNYESTAKSAVFSVANSRVTLTDLKVLLGIERRSDREWSFTSGIWADNIEHRGLDLPKWLALVMPRQIDIGLGLEFVDPRPIGGPFLQALQNPDIPPDPATIGPAVSEMTRNEAFRLWASPGRIRTDTLSMDFDVDFTPNAADRLAGGWVTAKGLDDLLALLQKQAPVPAPLMAGLYAAKALAVPGNDGDLRWDFSVDRDRRITVNGKPVGPQAK